MADGPEAVNSIVPVEYSVHNSKTMLRLSLTSILILLAACTPLRIYHKPGVSVTRMQNDQLDCEVAALKEAPVASQLRRSPPEYFPGRRYCNSDGKCYRRGGYWIPGEVYSVDVNSTLRKKLENRCMAQLGYTPVELPQCRSDKSSPPADTSRTETLPALTDDSCAIRNDDGSWRIVN